MKLTKGELSKMEGAQYDPVIDQLGQLIEQMTPLSTSLTSAERQRFRNIGQRRKGFVDDVIRAGSDFGIYVPGDISIDDLQRKADLHEKFKKIQNLAKVILEFADDNAFAVGNEIMNEVDSCYNALQAATSRNMGLAKVMQAVEVHYSRSRSSDPENGNGNGASEPDIPIVNKDADEQGFQRLAS